MPNRPVNLTKGEAYCRVTFANENQLRNVRIREDRLPDTNIRRRSSTRVSLAGPRNYEGIETAGYPEEDNDKEHPATFETY